MPDQDDTPTTVSVEAHQRVTAERDELKGQVTELTQVARDASRINRAYEHFRSQEGFTGDAYGVALAAMRDINVRDAADDSFTGSLDQWLQTQSSMFSAPTAPPSDEGETEQAPAEPAAPSVSGPSPNASGSVVTAEVMTSKSPEYLKMKERGDFDGIKRAINEGRLVLPGEHFARIRASLPSA